MHLNEEIVFTTQLTPWKSAPIIMHAAVTAVLEYFMNVDIPQVNETNKTSTAS